MPTVTVLLVPLALLVVVTGLKAIRRQLTVRLPSVPTVGAVGLAILLLAGTPAPILGQHVFALPEPTGHYAVGVRYLHLVDETRTDPFLEGASRPRELMVKLYYPAVPDPGLPTAPYFHGSAEFAQAIADFYQLPASTLDHLSLADTHAKEGLAVSPDEPKFPVILFSHGAGTSMEVHTAPSENLASHGYVVVAIDHTYVSAATEFPTRIVRAGEATTLFDVPEPAVPITRIMVDDVQFVIHELGELNDWEIDPAFEGRLDLEALGVIGHSVGGAVAYDLAITDARVRAAVNLDGAVYVAPDPQDAMAPFLMVASDQVMVPALEQRLSLMEMVPPPSVGESPGTDATGPVETDDNAIGLARQNMAALADVLAASGNLYTVTSCGHMLYTDIGLYFDRPTRELLQMGGDTDPARCLQATSALTVAFFDQHLKGQAGATPESLSRTYPELEQVELN